LVFNLSCDQISPEALIGYLYCEVVSETRSTPKRYVGSDLQVVVSCLQRILGAHYYIPEGVNCEDLRIRGIFCVLIDQLVYYLACASGGIGNCLKPPQVHSVTQTDIVACRTDRIYQDIQTGAI
jgi:hypothetical protein